MDKVKILLKELNNKTFSLNKLFKEFKKIYTTSNEEQIEMELKF